MDETFAIENRILLNVKITVLELEVVNRRPIASSTITHEIALLTLEVEHW